jgi:hypothetical protein
MQEVGCRQFADDALLFRLDHDRIMARVLPFNPRLRPASRAHFPRARYASPSFSQPFSADVPLHAIFLMQQNSGLNSGHISLMPRAVAFSELLPLAHCFDTENPTHTRRLVDDYLQLAARVPAFRFEYRPDLQNLSQLTQNIMEVVTKISSSQCFS